MKKTLYFLLLFFSLIISSNSTYGQGFPYHLYDTRTISELVELNITESKKLKPNGTKQIMISAKPFYSAIRLEYAGQSRSLSKERLGLFKIWQESFEIDSKLDNMLDKEFLFRECEKEY